ncbi:MAG: rod shape-determining protein [Calditrichaceae bacterium]|nr:rod shape-determining protein [Calditrichaceae bacterium]MBN2708914.1 rod shape-determining protein [Calditrichaceae bacterium]RQV97562.1 MAG: rod shape-determining protein [Calditrichota bacterium]
MAFFLNRLFKNIGIDLGTANTIVYIYDKGYVVNEPSVIAFKNNSTVFSIGFEAKEMIGKTHRDIRVIRPMADGVIADFTAGEAMLREFIKMAEVPSFMINKIVIGVPTGITSVEKKAVIDSAVMAGARRVHLVSEPMAAAIGVGLNVLDSNANLIIDIGGGTTDIAVINYGGIVLDNTLRIASDEMNEAIVRFVKNRYHLRIGDITAEKIKIEHGIAHESMEEKTFTLKGIDYQTGLPRQLVVSNKMFLEALSGILNAITNAIIATLDQLPPELAGDIIDRGIVLTGGGSLLRGLDVRLREILNVPVSRPGNALLCVAEGTRKILESFDTYEQLLMS